MLRGPMSKKITSLLSKTKIIWYWPLTEKLHWFFNLPWSLWVSNEGENGFSLNILLFSSVFF